MAPTFHLPASLKVLAKSSSSLLKPPESPDSFYSPGGDLDNWGSSRSPKNAQEGAGYGSGPSVIVNRSLTPAGREPVVFMTPNAKSNFGISTPSLTPATASIVQGNPSDFASPRFRVRNESGVSLNGQSSGDISSSDPLDAPNTGTGGRLTPKLFLSPQSSLAQGIRRPSELRSPLNTNGSVSVSRPQPQASSSSRKPTVRTHPRH